MDTMLLRIFQRHVLEQCEAVLISRSEMDPRSPRLWYAAGNLVVATANLSKAFWGQRGDLATQREPLRASLGVSDSSPLRATTMRNHFEHIDERVDLWWEKSPDRNYVDANIGDPNQLITGVSEIDIFRTYDPQTGILHFWGDRFDTHAIVGEVQRILPMVRVEAAKPHWTP
jgi:hypothetical protein